MLRKDHFKKRGVAGQEEFGQMELESMAKGGKVLAFEIRLAEYKDETLKNGKFAIVFKKLRTRSH